LIEKAGSGEERGEKMRMLMVERQIREPIKFAHT